MKRIFLSLLSLASVFMPQLRAQEPFVYETATELTSVINLNGDALTDIVIADKATGALRFGTATASGVTWQTQLTGVVPLESMAVGAKLAGQTDICAVTSSLWNAVELVTPGGSQQRLRITGLGISTLAPRDGAADVILKDLFMSTSLPNQTFILANEISADREVASKLAPKFRSGNSFRITDTNRESLMIDEVAHTAQLWYMAPIAGTPTFIERLNAPLTGLPAQARVAEVPIVNTDGYRNFHLAYWAPAATAFSLSWLNTIAPPRFEPAVSISTGGLALGSVHFLSSTGTGGRDTLLLLTSADGLSARTVVLPSGGNTLTLRQAFTAPAGQSFTGALALANGGFYFLQGKNGRTAEAQLINYNGSTHTAATLSTLPILGGTRTQSNVFTFTAEPFVNPDAAFTRSFKVRDWTVTATNNAGTLSVSALQDSGPTGGLGSAASQNVSGATAGNFAVPNQLRPDVSLAMLGTGFGVPRERLLIEPPSGRYRPLTDVNAQTFFPIEFANASAMEEIYFRLNGGRWIKYDATVTALTPPAATDTVGRPILTASGTVEAFGVPTGTEVPTPSTRNTYQLSATSPLTTTPVIDSNNNGLSDAWEKAFGMTDPAGDADGDGSTNLSEYLAGTDPRSAGSIPTPTGELPPLFITSVSTTGGAAPQVEIFWLSPRTDLLLESSSTLQAPWSPVAAVQITTSGQRHAHRHSVSASPRFFRLRQP